VNLQALPKAELHCHLDGILSPAMARAIRRDDPAFPIAPEDFTRIYANTLSARFATRAIIPR